MATVPYRPSNGSEGHHFMSQWCAKCQRDAAFQADPENGTGCPIAADSMAYRIDDPSYPKEWVVNADDPVGRTARCTAFEALT